MRNDLPTQTISELTEREKEILRLLATGTSNKEIARLLSISSNTVKVHLRNIFAKIGVASRTEAAMYAIQTGLVVSPAATGQENGIPAEAKGTLAASPTPATDVIPKPRFGLRQAGIVAFVVIFLVMVGMGVLLLRQKNTPTAISNQPTPTTESRWHILATLPTARNGLAVTTYENKVYAIGGENAQGITGALERYDPATNSWVNLTPKPVPVTDVNAAVIGGRIYVTGGRLASGEVTNILEIYDPQLDRWERGAPMPVSLSAYAEVAFEGKLYLFGGWDGKHFLASVYEYNPDQDKWGSRSPMPTARSLAGAATAEGRIYVIGGYDGKQALKINEVYSALPDDSKNSWSQAEPMPEGRYAFGMASIADAIYILGGKGESKGIPAPLLFTIQTAKWQTYETPPVNIGSDVRLTGLGQYLYALGGTDNGTSGYNLTYQAIYTVLLPIVP